MNTLPKCIAHRGASGVAPENTLLAFWTAINSQADVIELDVQITKDRELVIFHDRNLERITGDKGGIADFTLDELNKKNYGSWMNENFHNITIPTLREVLEELPSSTNFVLEIKPQNREIEKDNYLEIKILDELDEYRGKNGVGDGYISVRSESVHDWIKSNSKHPCGLMQKKRTIPEFIDIVKNHNIEFSQIRWRNYQDADYRMLKDTGTKTMVFYADFPSEWDFLIQQNIAGILTNYPALLSGYLHTIK